MIQTLAEQIFGGVSDCKGMGTGGGYKDASIPEGAFGRLPRYHEGEQVDPATMAADDKLVQEKDLCEHF